MPQPNVSILVGDVREQLRTLPDEHVNCVVTSPPYWGLRDYGCGGQIGLEPTLGEHIAALVGVFREVRRVLRRDGTFWLNYGDAYAGSRGAQSREHAGKDARNPSKISANQIRAAQQRTQTGSLSHTPGLKSKDRMLIPARLAIALQEDGWWVRDEIVWHKPNPMPISVRDRTTPAHEFVYMLSKAARYQYNEDTIAEPAVSAHPSGNGFKRPQQLARGGRGNAEQWTPRETRNCRSVWTIPTKPFPEAHFATFPPDLVRPCILAGCPEGGTVLDPFFGAGTTGLVAIEHGRNCIGIELNPDYAVIARKRLGLGEQIEW